MKKGQSGGMPPFEGGDTTRLKAKKRKTLNTVLKIGEHCSNTS